MNPRIRDWRCGSRTSEWPQGDIRLRRARSSCWWWLRHPKLPAARAETSAGAETACTLITQEWHKLEDPLLWRGTAAEAAQGGVPVVEQLPPPWKVMLLSDGSVTRHLQLLTGREVAVDCLQMELLEQEPGNLPPGAELLPRPLLQRQVLLRPHSSSCSTGSGSAPAGRATAAGQDAMPTGVAPEPSLVYAASWWNAGTVDRYLQDRSAPIWVSLSQGQVELYRELRNVYCGHSARLEVLLGCKGPFWARHYLFWHGGQPLTLIYEVFSNRLQEYLGQLPPMTVADGGP